MEFALSCECGISVPIRSTEAGGTVECACGRVLDIPTLAQLRRGVGLEGIPKTPAERVEEKIASGELPRDSCICCQSFAETGIRLFVECERSQIESSGGFNWGIFLFSLLLPVSVYAWDDEEVKERGRDIVVPLPMSFCLGCRGRIPRFGHFAIIKFVRVLLFILAVIALVAGNVVWLFLLLAFAFAGAVEFILRRWNQSNAKELMRNEEAYRELLEYFPNATITD